MADKLRSVILDADTSTPVTGDFVPAEAGEDAASVGITVGPYQLLQKLGEGGMGVVWLAEQIRAGAPRSRPQDHQGGHGLAARSLARFEAERQALALMDHPNIAKVLDAGMTQHGRPVLRHGAGQGHPDHQVLRRAAADAAQRLELFMPVCQAVQHAHQKGIIHRDLKPSNVLVALYDGKPVPKVIDFGVAKATAPRLTEQHDLHRRRSDRRHAWSTWARSRPS